MVVVYRTERNHLRLEDLDTFLYASTILVCTSILLAIHDSFPGSLYRLTSVFWHRNAHGFTCQNCFTSCFFLCAPLCATAYCKDLGDEDVMLEIVTYS